MSNKYIYLVVGFIFILIISLSLMGEFREIYYQAVYDTCVRLSAVNGQVTSFDLLQCREMEQRARRERWYGTPMVEEDK